MIESHPDIYGGMDECVVFTLWCGILLGGYGRGFCYLDITSLRVCRVQRYCHTTATIVVVTEEEY